MSYSSPEPLTRQSVFLLAIRPKTLPASVSPVVLGTAMVPLAHINWLLALCALGCALFLQIAVNLANDYFDAKSGVDSDHRKGPTRVTQAGLASPSSVAAGIAFFIVLSIVCGLILVAHSDIYLLIVGCFCVLATLGYSGGPFPLASHGLGEIAVLIFFGWVAVIGSAYVHTQQLGLELFLLANGLGVILAAIMLVNNIRDISTDRLAGKRTLAVRLGETWSKRVYVGLLLFTIVCHIWVFLYLRNNILTTLVPLALYIPFAFRSIKHLYQYTGEKFNILLAETSVLSLTYSLPTGVMIITTGG